MLSIIGAVALGLAFGFALQRGGFCGASLLSSVVLYKDFKGLVGILVAVLVSMVGFAVLAHLGWIVPNPNPLRLLSAVVGGVVFGVGMVLAGGCVTGTLYKAGEGRLTSILALVGIGIGSTAVTSGSLVPMKKTLVLASKEIRWQAGLNEAFDLPYVTLGVVIGGVGLAVLLVAFIIRRQTGRPMPGTYLKGLVSGGWSPVTAGVVIGILGWCAYLLSSADGRNYPLGGHGGVKGAFSLLVTGEYSGSQWTIFLVGGIVIGSAISTRMRRDLKLRSAEASTLLVALVGGVLVGIGAAVGRGCFIGNNVSGLALLSIHSFIFAICTVVANWVTTALYLRGIR